MHKLRQIGSFTKINRLVVRRRCDAVHLHILRRNRERLDQGAIRIDTGLFIICGNLIATEEPICHGDIKLDNQLLTTRSIRLNIFGNIVLVEIKARHINGARGRINFRFYRSGSSRRSIERTISVVIRSVQANIFRRFRNREVRRHDVFDDCAAAKVDVGTADRLADGGENVLQGCRVSCILVVASGTLVKVLGDRISDFIMNQTPALSLTLQANFRSIFKIAGQQIQESVSGRPVCFRKICSRKKPPGILHPF